MLKVSPLPALPQLRAHQHQGRCSNTRIVFKTRKGAKLKPQKSPWLDFAADVEHPPLQFTSHIPAPSSFVFEVEPLSRYTNTSNKLEFELFFDNLSLGLNNWAQAWPVAVRRLIAGGIAGAISKTATAPLEAIKLQVVQGHTNSLKAARMLYCSGGFGAFFHGNGLDVLRTSIGKGIELATFDALKRIIFARNRRKSPEMVDEVRKQDNSVVPNAVLIALAGATAGILSMIAVHPLECLRTRLALGTCDGSVNPLNFSRFTAWSCITEIIRNEGIGALFYGLDASIIGIMPYAAIRLSTYDALKNAFKRATGDEHLNPRYSLVFGAIAGVSSAVVTFPLEVARRRMMAGGPYPNVGVALVGIVSKEGVGALFRGVELTVMKQAPQYALGFASYEIAKRALAL